MNDNTKPAQFRKKPVVIEAVQFTKAMAEGHEPLPDGVQMAARNLAAGGQFPEYANDGKFLTNYSTCHQHFIATPEGQMDVQIGDWIIRGVKGEFYPCKPDIFAATYEPADTKPARADSVERIAALLCEEATGRSWTVAGIEYVGPDRTYYRNLARKVVALTQQPAADAEWIKHPQTIEAKSQWDAVAQALGADRDDPDAVLAAARRARLSAAPQAVRTSDPLPEGHPETIAAAKAYIRDWCPDHVRDYVASLAAPQAAEPVAEVSLHDGLLYGKLNRDLPVGTKLCVAPPAASTPQAAEPVAYPTGSDREVLLYLMQQFDIETWQCPQCGHAEDCATMDSADYLRSYLATHAAPPAASEDVPLGAIENGRAFADRLEVYPFESVGGDLRQCCDWHEFRRCFEHLAQWALGRAAMQQESGR
ncbi:hypothetical protein [Coralloluteibacterium thermophilus]|uniref:Uncharacterized protein n=1 Tax=Coralloluteibacterium thermophilum TaxID=2707049 RepID=A0ABV9NI42_9GAMM